MESPTDEKKMYSKSNDAKIPFISALSAQSVKAYALTFKERIFSAGGLGTIDLFLEYPNLTFDRIGRINSDNRYNATKYVQIDMRTKRKIRSLSLHNYQTD